MRHEILFSSVQSLDWLGRQSKHEGRISRDLPVLFAGSPCEQLRHGQGCPLFDVVHLSFPLADAEVGQQRNFYCCSSKIEGVMNFYMNLWVILHPRHTVKVKRLDNNHPTVLRGLTYTTVIQGLTYTYIQPQRCSTHCQTTTIRLDIHNHRGVPYTVIQLQ